MGLLHFSGCGLTGQLQADHAQVLNAQALNAQDGKWKVSGYRDLQW